MMIRTLLLLLLAGAGLHAADVRQHESYKKWLIALLDGPEDQRQEAAAALRDLGADAAPMLGALRVALLNTQDDLTADLVAEALIVLGPEARAALPDLLEALRLGIIELAKAAEVAEAIGEPGHPEIIRYFFRPPEPEFLQAIERNDAPLGLLVEMARRAPNKVLPAVLAQLQREDINLEDVLMVLDDVLRDEYREQTPGDHQTLDERVPWFLPETREALVRALRPLLKTVDLQQRQQVMELLFVVQPTLVEELFPAYFALVGSEGQSASVDVTRLVAFYGFRPLLAKLASAKDLTEELALQFLSTLAEESGDVAYQSTQFGRRLLVQALGHPVPAVRVLILELLAPSLPFERSVQAAFRTRLYDPDLNVRFRAAHSLLNASLANADLGRVFLEFAAAPSHDKERRVEAITDLGRMGVEARFAVPLLLRLSKSTNEDLRLAAAQALANIDPTMSSSILPILKANISTGDGGTWATYMAIARLGPRAAALIPVIQEQWKEEKDVTRLTMAYTLAEIDVAHQAKYIAYLRNDFGDTPTEGNLSTARCLQLLGPKAKDALPELTQLLRQVETRTQDALDVATACLRLDPTHAPTLQTLRALLATGASTVIHAIARLGPHGIHLVPDLVAVVKNTKFDPHSRLQALNALHQLGSHAKSVIPQLEALPDDDLMPYVQRTLRHLRACA